MGGDVTASSARAACGLHRKPAHVLSVETKEPGENGESSMQTHIQHGNGNCELQQGTTMGNVTLSKTNTMVTVGSTRLQHSVFLQHFKVKARA